MNIRPAPNLRRTPQTAQSSPSRSLATAASTTKNSAGSTSWDSAHWVVGTPPLRTSATASNSQGNNSPISNTGAFAGVIVGVSVSCLVVIGFLIYRIKHPKPRPQTNPQDLARFSQLASSTKTGPIKLPPQPALPDRTLEHDHPLDHTSSNPFSSRRSSQRIINSPATSSDASPRSGPLFTPPGTPIARDMLESSQRSERAPLSQRHSRSIFDLFSSASSGITWYPGQGVRLSAGTVSSPPTSQAASLRRPLPVPSHSPPPYSSKRASLRHSSQNNSGTPSPLASVFSSDEKRRSLLKSDGNRNSQVGQPKTFDEKHPVLDSIPSTDDRVDPGGLQSPFRDPPTAAVATTLASPRDSIMSSTSAEIQGGNAPPSSWRSTLSPHIPRPTSTASDPFNNKGFELPGWLDSDPYSRADERARATTSVYSTAQRSVAASSKILPSDTSLRTVSREPSEDNHDATLHVAVLTRFRTGSMTQGTEESAVAAAPGESVEGDGPESFAVRITSGAERRGWGREDLQLQASPQMTPSGSGAIPRPLRLDHSSPAALHPAPTSSSASPAPRGVPLSAEFEARGLGRSFIQSLISKVRWSSTAASDDSHPPRVPQDTMSWLREDPFELPRASLGAASSHLLPSEADHGDASSIRSNQAEMGWIDPQLGPTNPRTSLLNPIPEPVNESEVVDAPSSAINQEPGLSITPDAQESLSQSPSQPRTSPPTPPS